MKGPSFTDFLKQWDSRESRPVIDVARDMVKEWEAMQQQPAPSHPTLATSIVTEDDGSGDPISPDCEAAERVYDPAFIAGWKTARSRPVTAGADEWLSRILKFDSPAKRWIARHLDHEDREFCLIYPLARAQTGYGQVGGDQILVHRVVCEYRNGPAPTERHHAAHSCAKGHHGCVNPWHLSWKTPSENECDKHRDGTLNPQRKLTPEQVDEIRSMKGRERTVDTAERFSVSERNIRDIQSGKIWKLDRVRVRQFTEDEVLAIRATRGARSCRQVADEFGVLESVIDRIRRGKTYKYFGGTDPSLSRAERGVGS